MTKSIKVLILNYDKNRKKYNLGKQEIFLMQITEVDDLINDLPYNEENPVPIQIIAEDFIITKESRDTFSIENNRHNGIKITKNKVELNLFKEASNLLDKFNKKEFIRTLIYVNVILACWFYFLIVNIESIIILLTQKFANANITIFLLWLSLISIIGFCYFIYINIAKPFFGGYKIPLEYFNPSKVIIEKNEINLFCLFTSQLIYLFIFYPLYIL